MEKKCIVIGAGLNYYPGDKTFVFLDKLEKLTIFPKGILGYVSTEPQITKFSTIKPARRSIYFYSKKNILLLTLKCSSDDEFQSCLLNILRPELQLFKNETIHLSMERIETREH